MLYAIQKNKSIYDSAPGLRLIKEFADLERGEGDKMKFVMLVADYKSPLKQHPEQRRRELAALECGYKVMDKTHATLDFRAREVVAGKDEKVEAAIKKYREIQFNEDRGNMEMITQQIENIKEVLKQKTDDVDELQKRTKVLQTLPELVETRIRLAKIAGLKEEDTGETPAGEQRALSLIDKIHEENG